MKHILMMMSTIVAGYAEESNWVTYVSDVSKFVVEASAKDDSARAIKLVREEIERKLNGKIRGDFKVASVDWGYQVNFSKLQISTDEASWRDINEGFGEGFLDKSLKKLKVDIGP